MTTEPGALGVVEEWLAAVNAGDAGRLQQLTHDPVRITGPRGSGPADAAALAGWLTRAGFSSRPVGWFCGGNGRVVVDLDAGWAAGGRRRVGSFFEVSGGRVARFERFDDGVAAALAAAGLDPVRDAVTQRV